MSTEEAEPSAPVPMRRLLALAVPELPILGVASVALVIGSGMGLLFPQAVSAMVDTINGEPPDLPFFGTLSFDQLAMGLVAVFLLQAFFGMLRSWLFTVAGERVVAKLRSDLFSAILNQEIAFFDQSRTGELTNRLASDTTVLQNTVTVNISMALRFGVTAIGAALMMMYTSPRLSMISLAVVPVVALSASFYGRLVRRWSTDVQDALADASQVAEETIAGVRTVRSFAREEAEVGRYAHAVDRSYRLAAKRALALGVFNGFMTFAGYGIVAVVVWYGGTLVQSDLMTSGELTAFLLYTMMVAFSMAAGANLFGDFMKASGASQRVFQLMDRVNVLVPGAAPLDRVEGRVELQRVSFRYPSRPDIPVLVGFDLHVEPGQVVALVGPSGAGKSTVAQLLTRFYDPVEGVVKIDGHDLRELDPQSLRRQVGVVAQEPLLFASSIAENIRYGRPEATDDEVRAAARAANAEAFVDDFPDGFDTLVGERGVRLSGGQKQRIAIARALLKDPGVLVLDEATSALDSESEHLVQEALERLMKGRTTLVIAHRLSTVRGADEVVVLDGGKVVERGSHQALMELEEGLYRRLVEHQIH